MIPAAQAETAALLTRLTGTAPVETHISAVFLGPDEVLKLRKAVRLAFLDFSTLAERERTARREFALNREAAPGMYRGVAAVTRAADGSLALDGAGEVVDWVVRMARVPAEDFLEVLAPKGLDGALLDQLGDAVAALHAGLAPVARDQAAALRLVTHGNARAALDAGIEPVAVRAWLEATLAALAARAGWLAARSADGFVRRCHGDLHLGNLCLWQGRPAAFDALEFDEDLATIDTGYDLAFLLMDLDRVCGRGAANRVMNRYIARSGDAGLVGGLPPFLALRAMVRAHVQAARFKPVESQDYLRRAMGYLSPAGPRLLAIGGLSGTGKSTLARALAPEIGPAPGALVLRSDEIRKRLAGVAPEQRLPPAAYSAKASEAVFAVIARQAREALDSGHAVIADATYMNEARREQIAAAAGGAPFLGIWLEAPADLLLERVAARTGDASDADVGVLRGMLRAGATAGSWLAVPAIDREESLGVIRKALEEISFS